MDSLEDRQVFLCFGPAKAGTTFLQRTINLHPDVSCASEQNFSFLLHRLTASFADYNEMVTLLDARTGNQGADVVPAETVDFIARHAIEKILASQSNGEPIVGANDNSVLHCLEAFDELLASPKLICIFRHPLDMAISGWHHNLRLAEKEKQPGHREFVMKHGGFDGWLVHSAGLFARDVRRFREFSCRSSRTLLVRYEDLLGQKQRELCRIFGFLEASVEEEILEAVAVESSFERMKGRSGDPAFFWRGSSGYWKESVLAETRAEVGRIAHEALDFLEYECVE